MNPSSVYGVLMSKIRALSSGIKKIEVSADGKQLLFTCNNPASTVIPITIPNPVKTVDLVNKLSVDADGFVCYDNNRIANFTDDQVELLNKFGTNADGKLQWDGKDIGGGASGTIGTAWTTNVECGGMPANTAIDANMSVADFLYQLTVKYFAPVIVSFTGSATALNCKGDTVAGTTLSANVTKKSNPIASVKFLKDGVALTTDTSKPNGGTYTYGYGANITTDTTFKVEVTDGKSTVSKTLEYKFIDPMYYGMLSTTTPSESDITGLSKLIAEKSNKVLSFTGVNSRATLAYPASYGNLIKIEDQNAFDNTSGFTKSTVTINGVAYNVYQSGAATLNGFKYTFKFI